MNADAPETPSPALAELARACGVAVEYTAWNGERTPSAVGTIRSVLASLGVDARDDDACLRSLADLDDLTWRRLVPPVTVLVEGEAATIPVHVPHGAPVAASLMLEHGDPRALEQLDVYVPPRTLDGREVGRATFQVPGDLPLGWHRLEAATSGRRGRGWVVVTPARIDVPEHVRRDRPWGLAAQLYSVRSERSWGIGDFGDLADLCSLAAIREGADFLLINPLHAAEAVPPLEPSPYLPTSRRFLNPLYIRIEDIPEVAYVPSQHRAVIEWESERPRRANLDADLLDRDAAWRAKSAALEKIFEVERSAARQARFEAFCLREGDALEEFATWCAIAEAHKGLPWPEEFRNPRAREVDAWRDEHGERVLFFAWLQWIADEQLARAQAAAHEAGMGIGIMTDLAVGVHPQGADAWALGRVLATGMEVGAPPDMYNQHGQNWSQPPWQPRALEAAAYMPFRDVVRAAVRHSGALRVDHILGLFRQWWIPAGNRADDGVYVQFDHEALIGILALEAQRAGTIVIGEDLGTLEPWVSDYLNQRGLLGTVVALFEKGADGGPQAPENYRADALVSVTVHDLPPTAPFLAGEHIAAREELGLIVGDAEQARDAARDDRRRLADYLLERGWMPQDWEEDDLVAGVHRMAMHSPALLTAVSLTDAVGDRRSQNHPGTSTEYPNWRIPLTDKSGAVVLLDDIFDNERLQRLLEAVRTARR